MSSRPTQVPSGEALAWEFNETNQALAEKADQAEACEIEIHRIFGRWLSKGENWIVEIDYPEEFGVEDFLTKVRSLSEAAKETWSQTAKREAQKQIVRRMFPKEDKVLLAQMEAEIDEGEDELVDFSALKDEMDEKMKYPKKDETNAGESGE